jgi:3-isopropylmalate dehydratase small subunit
VAEVGDGAGRVTVDLESQTGDPRRAARPIPSRPPETLRQMLLQGIDEIELTLGKARRDRRVSRA